MKRPSLRAGPPGWMLPVVVVLLVALAIFAGYRVTQFLHTQQAKPALSLTVLNSYQQTSMDKGTSSHRYYINTREAGVLKVEAIFSLTSDLSLWLRATSRPGQPFCGNVLDLGYSNVLYDIQADDACEGSR